MRSLELGVPDDMLAAVGETELRVRLYELGPILPVALPSCWVSPAWRSYGRMSSGATAPDDSMSVWTWMSSAREVRRPGVAESVVSDTGPLVAPVSVDRLPIRREL